MKYHKYFFIILLLICFSCSSKKDISMMVTGKESSKQKVWIDASTGHKVKKIVNLEGNNRSFYFHNNPFLKSKNGESDLMIFSNRKGNDFQYFSVDLKSKKVTQITFKKGKKRGEIIGPKTRKVFYMIQDSVFATHIDTHKTEFIYKFNEDVVGSVTTLNADETLLGGAIITKAEKDILKKNPQKSSYFDKIYNAKLERSLITIDVKSKLLTSVYSENAWLNHIQFSPTDPKNLMYCHEGPWHKVDRIWNIDIATHQNKLIHQRTMDWEIAGHEFFSSDGDTVWYDLQVPRSVTFFLAGKNLKTGKDIRYELQRDEWSIHYNISPNQKTFAGDGGDAGQVARAKDGRWIYHFVPEGNHLKSTKLVNMKNHNYDLEPNVHFSPDGTQIIFRANFEGSSQIYAVEIKKQEIQI